MIAKESVKVTDHDLVALILQVKVLAPEGLLDCLGQGCLANLPRAMESNCGKLLQFLCNILLQCSGNHVCKLTFSWSICKDD